MCNLILIYAVALTLAFTLTLAVSLTLGADVIAQHGAENEVLLGRELVERTGDDETDGVKTLAASEIDVQVLLSGRLKHIRNALALQARNGLLAVALVACEQHHLAHAFIEFVDVVHQHLHLCRNSLCCSRHFYYHLSGCKGTANPWIPQYLKRGVLSTSPA